MKQIVFIIGMHRSGSSLIARAVEVAGASMGDNLMGAATDNPKGFYEDLDVFSFNERLLSALKSRWDLPTLLLDWDIRDFMWETWIDEARALLVEKMVGAPIIALKDPRFSLLLPLWQTAAQTLDVVVKYVVCIRNPLDVANSLEARDGFKIEKGMALWVSHNYSIVNFLSDLKEDRLVVSYERLLDDPATELRNLSQLLGTEQFLDIESAAKSFIEGDLDSSLCHSRSDIESLIVIEDSAPYVSKIYEFYLDSIHDGWEEIHVINLIQNMEAEDLESYLYSIQRRNYDDDIDRAVRDRTIAIESKIDSAMQLISDRETSLKEAKDRNVELVKSNQNYDKQLELLKENVLDKQKQIDESRLECRKITELQGRTHQHMEGALKNINDLEKSLSYKLGRGMTFPARIPYQYVILPFKKHPENIRLMAWMGYYALRHPLKSAEMLRWQTIKNAGVTFFSNPGSARSVVSHYGRLMHGSGPGAFSVGSDALKKREETSASDRVSVIVVNYNGSRHLKDLLDSLLGQDYHDYEIIVVDNGSSDGSADYIRKNYPVVRLVALESNTGFAEGNNIGAEVASGDYYCLVNNDVEVKSDFVSSLVGGIHGYPEIGAVGAKMLFWKRFITLKLRANADVFLDEGALREGLRVYPKWFFVSGWDQQSTNIDGKSDKGFSREAVIRVAVCTGQEKLSLRFRATSLESVELFISSFKNSVEINVELLPNEWCEAELDFTGHADELDEIINNAGTWVSSVGDVGDRGFGEPDSGQYEKAELVDALCGGAILIRRSALNDQPIFAKDYFAYYEDTELSLRLRGDGYGLRYIPSAVLYHKHASTSSENSPFFKYHVNRNRLLFLAEYFDEKLWRQVWKEEKGKLNHLMHYFQNSENVSKEDLEFSRMIPGILDSWESLLPKIQDGCLLDRQSLFPRIAVYNNYWSTLGGGEHHASVIAQALTSLGPVDLISEQEFDIRALENQFDIDLRYCRKRLVSAEEIHHDPSLTGGYDIFVNSTYGSDLRSYARKSLYIVSFPYELVGRDAVSKAFLSDYQFLANSYYTQCWVGKWWGVESDVLYPAVHLPDQVGDVGVKQKEILHVGRFFKIGHNKKQLELVKVFKRLVDGGNAQGWHLTLAGQVAEQDESYVEKVLQEAEGYSVSIRTNITIDVLRDLYKMAAIYWHATGLNEEPDKHPELKEHFGITTVEAMSYGCLPVVINGGGQAEIVENERCGFLFQDEKGLEEVTMDCMLMFVDDLDLYSKISKAAAERSKDFSRKQTKSTLLGIVESNGFHVSQSTRILN